MTRRAVASEDKQARRDAILKAAAALFLSRQGGLPSASEIAAAAGLAKGTVYLYFRTKEEIFIALLASELDALLVLVASVFRSSEGQPSAKVAAFIDVFAVHLEERPELLRMDALGYGVLEANLDAERKREFKAAFAQGLTATGKVIEGALELAPGRGVQLLMRSFALTRGLWQSADLTEAWASFASDAHLAILYPDFRAELREALGEYWRGALDAGGGAFVGVR